MSLRVVELQIGCIMSFLKALKVYVLVLKSQIFWFLVSELWVPKWRLFTRSPKLSNEFRDFFFKCFSHKMRWLFFIKSHNMLKFMRDFYLDFRKDIFWVLNPKMLSVGNYVRNKGLYFEFLYFGWFTKLGFDFKSEIFTRDK